MLRKLAVMAGWAGAAFAVRAAFMMALFDRPNVVVALIYGAALATTFALHRATRGPSMLAVAFGLGWALLVEGVAYSVTAEEASLHRRGIFALLLGLPFVALVVRRFSTDHEDAWFRRHARRVVALSLVVALPSLVAGAVGSAKADPAPYDRARSVLVDGRFTMDYWFWLAGMSDRSPCRFDALRAATSDVDPAVRNEVLRTCEPFATDEPRRACQCMTDLLLSRGRAERERRDDFRTLALASAVPLGIALLFAWRGRRERETPS